MIPDESDTTALGQANAAHALLKSLPQALSSASAPTDQADEYGDYVRLFELFAAHDLVGDVSAHAPKETAGRVEQANWAKKLNVSGRAEGRLLLGTEN